MRVGRVRGGSIWWCVEAESAGELSLVSASDRVGRVRFVNVPNGSTRIAKSTSMVLAASRVSLYFKDMGQADLVVMR